MKFYSYYSSCSPSADGDRQAAVRIQTHSHPHTQTLHDLRTLIGLTQYSDFGEFYLILLFFFLFLFLNSVLLLSVTHYRRHVSVSVARAHRRPNDRDSSHARSAVDALHQPLPRNRLVGHTVSAAGEPAERVVDVRDAITVIDCSRRRGVSLSSTSGRVELAVLQQII